MTDLEIIDACDSGPNAMEALGLPAPKTLGDVIHTMREAQDRLSKTDKRRLATRDRMELGYIASATKCPGAYPKRTPLPFPE
jgi:hypothetical protein